MSMPRQALANDLAIESIQGGEKSRCSVALVVMSHGFSSPAFHRQPRLGAVKSLNLALFVHAQDKSVIGRIKIQPHDVLEFVNEPGIPAELKAPYQVRFQPVLLPNAPDGRSAETRSGSHATRAPLRRSLRLLIESSFNYLSHLGFVYALFAPGPGAVTKQTCYAGSFIAGAPPRDSWRGRAQLLHDLACRQAFRAHHGDARPQRQLLRRIPVAGYLNQRGSVRIAHGQSFASLHASIIT